MAIIHLESKGTGVSTGWSLTGAAFLGCQIVARNGIKTSIHHTIRAGTGTAELESSGYAFELFSGKYFFSTKVQCR